jgi:hypothetical protein
MIKWKGKNLVPKPMTPQQLLAEHLQKSSEVRVECEKKNVSALHKSVSESHKPYERDKNKIEDKSFVMLATKCEMRDVRCNPGPVLIVLVYKDLLRSANDITSLPSVVSRLL